MSRGFRYLLAGPAVTLGLLVLLPLAGLVLGASVETVRAALLDREVLLACLVSLTCALTAVLLGLVLGVPAAYLLARSRRRWRVLRALLDLPVVIPHPIVGVGLLLVFAKNRVVGAALREHFGVSLVSAAPGVILAMLVVSSPFVIKAAHDAFKGVPRALERVGQSLGASDARVFFTVALPLAWPNIRSGALLAWARAVSEFGSVVILAYYPLTAPVLIWDRFSARGLEAALGPSLLLLAVCLAIVALLQWTTPRPQELDR
jgi:molybdate/tungstate transport system permease protein